MTPKARSRPKAGQESGGEMKRKVCFFHHNYVLDGERDHGFIKQRLRFTSHVLLTSQRFQLALQTAQLGGTQELVNHSCTDDNPPSLFLRRTLTSRTSHPAGVMGWLSALWCTPSSPPSLTTTLCRLPTANTTLNCPLEPQSE